MVGGRALCYLDLDLHFMMCERLLLGIGCDISLHFRRFVLGGLGKIGDTRSI
jgi:hypothetical protein